MSDRSYSERDLAQWLEATGRTPMPDYVDSLLARTAGQRQRSALLPERWIPMQFTTQVPLPLGRQVPLRTIALVGLLITALIVGAVVAAGALRRRPALPYGPAVNGSVIIAVPDGDSWKRSTNYVVPQGDILAVDPVNGATRMLVGGPALDGFPVVSLDGTQVAFVREVSGGQMLFVVDVGGGQPRALTVAHPTVGDVAWSPDGQSIAFTSNVDDVSQLWIAGLDGRTPLHVDIGPGMSAVLPQWRPPSGDEILFVASNVPSGGFLPRYGYRDVRGAFDDPTGTGIGLFLVGADGTDLHQITPMDGDGYDYGHVSWAPDGDRIVTQVANESGNMRVRILNALGAHFGDIEPTTGIETVSPVVSPDGTRIAFAEMTYDTWRIRTVAINGVADPADTGPDFFGQAATFRWSPDGTSIVVNHHYFHWARMFGDRGGPVRDLPLIDPGSLAWQRLGD